MSATVTNLRRHRAHRQNMIDGAMILHDIQRLAKEMQMDDMTTACQQVAKMQHLSDLFLSCVSDTAEQHAANLQHKDMILNKLNRRQHE